MLIAAAAVGAATHLLDRLTARSAGPAQPDPAAATTGPSPPHAKPNLGPAAAKGVADLKSALLGLQAAQN